MKIDITYCYRIKTNNCMEVFGFIIPIISIQLFLFEKDN